MKSSKLIYSLLIALTLVSAIDAHAKKKKDVVISNGERIEDPDRSKRNETVIVSIYEAGAAGRLADRLIVRSNSMMDKRQIPTVAKVYGDRLVYTRDAQSLSKLSSLSAEVLTMLAQTGKCDATDSDCIVFEDSKDSAYRLATTPTEDGAIAVMMAKPEQWGAGDNSTRGLANRVDGATHARSVIMTRSNSSY